MAPRWPRTAAVLHPDDLSAPPHVVDPHESEPLPRDGPLLANWHGPPAQRAMAAASIIVVIAGIGLFGFFAVSDILGAGSSPSDPGSPIGSAAGSEGSTPEAPGAGSAVDDLLGNATATPSPGLP